jgi:transcriptional regulator with XRE-family HTH domain
VFKLRVNEVREAKGFSIGLLSRKSNVPQSAVQRLCKDPNYIPSFLTMVKVARTLKVPLEELFLYEEDEDSDAQ